jgi:hypothetical protein
MWVCACVEGKWNMGNDAREELLSCLHVQRLTWRCWKLLPSLIAGGFTLPPASYVPVHHGRKLEGSCMEAAWKLHGSCMAVRGSCMEDDFHAGCMQAAWKLPPQTAVLHTGDMYRSSGGRHAACSTCNMLHDAEKVEER